MHRESKEKTSRILGESLENAIVTLGYGSPRVSAVAERGRAARHVQNCSIASWNQARAYLNINLSDFQDYRHDHRPATGGFLDEALMFRIKPAEADARLQSRRSG